MNLNAHAGRLLALPEVMAMYGKSKAAVYADVRRGLLPKAITLSSRCARWPEADIDSLVALRAAGGNDQDAQRLVQKLVADRAASLQAIRQGLGLAH